MPLSQQLREWRQAAGLSQPQAAQRLGVPEGTYLHWEHGDRQPSAFAQRAIALCIAEKVVGGEQQQTTANNEQL